MACDRVALIVARLQRLQVFMVWARARVWVGVIVARQQRLQAARQPPREAEGGDEGEQQGRMQVQVQLQVTAFARPSKVYGQCTLAEQFKENSGCHFERL